MKISACLIVKNEAANIARCLQSIYRSVDEIILVDTGSKDATISIAKQYGAKVFSYIWKNDFASAKNYAIAKAKGNWIIFLDADEYFSEKTIPNIRQVILQHGTVCDAFSIRMVNIDVDKQNKILEYFYPIRIFRANTVIRYMGKVHEHLVKTDRTSLKVSKVSPNLLELIHTGYSSSVIEKKCRRNLPILLKELEVEPEDVSVLAYLMDCYFNLKDYQRAVDYAEKIFSFDTSSLEYCSRIYRRLIKALQCLNAPVEEMKKVILAAIERFSVMPDFYGEYALLLVELGKFEEGLAYFAKADQLEAAYTEDEPSFYSYLRQPKENLQAMLYLEKNDVAQALAAYCKLLQENKYNENAFKQVILILKNENPVDIIGFLNKIYQKENAVELNFLIGNLTKYRKDNVLAYYLNLYYELKNDSLEKAVAFCCVKKYEEALRILERLLNQSENIEIEEKIQMYQLLVVCLMQGNRDMLSEIIKKIPMDLQRIVMRFFDLESTMQLDQRETYLHLIGEVYAIEENLLIKYVRIATDFSTDFLLEIVQELLQYNAYQAALAVAEIAAGRKDKYLDKAIEKIAYIAYRSQDYGKAKKYYELIIPNKIEDNASMQYYEWSCQRI